METEEIIAKVLSQLADVFKNQLILKGGVLLRLLNSPRSTRDLDYVWIRTKKRNLFGEEVKKSLNEINGISVTDIQSNSRGVFIEIQDQSSRQKVKIEISVVASTGLPPKPISTAVLAKLYNLKTQVIAAMDPSEAFSHKIAAALERNLVRDLYDLSQMEPLTPFDPKTLEERLSRLEISRAKPRHVAFEEAANLLQKKLDQLSQKKIETELFGVIPDDQFPGLDLIIRATVSRIIQRLKVMSATPS